MQKLILNKSLFSNKKKSGYEKATVEYEAQQPGKKKETH